MSPKQLHDRIGRRIDNLRISVTDRCNFRCTYCMPEEGLPWLPHTEVLSFEEITRLARLFVEAGIRKLRITGGEPLVRRDLPDLIRMLHAIDGVEDLALTTNGILLPEQAKELKDAGLERINVSLDSLTTETFQRIVRRDALAGVMAGLEAASEHFDGPVKVNAVLLRGVNDSEIPAFAELARTRGFEIRFIEFMPLDADASWSRETLVTGDEILGTIQKTHAMRIDPSAAAAAPSRDYVFSDGSPGKIGFINSVSNPFCAHCNRIRITANGRLRTCLFSTTETDLRALIRSEKPQSSQDREVLETIRSAVWNKEPGHKINDPDFVRANRSMSQIGG